MTAYLWHIRTSDGTPNVVSPELDPGRAAIKWLDTLADPLPGSRWFVVDMEDTAVLRELTPEQARDWLARETLGAVAKGAIDSKHGVERRHLKAI